MTGNLMNKLVMIVVLMLSAAPAIAAEKSATFSVPDMTCALCPLTIKTAMGNVPGVKSAEATFETKLAVAVFDDALTSPEAIAAASADAGYPATLVSVQ